MDELILPSRIINGDFSGWLRDAMAERRITQRALAMRTGIDHSSISRLLARDRIPSLSTAVAIVKVLSPSPLRVGTVSERASPMPRTRLDGLPAQVREGSYGAPPAGVAE